MTPASFLLARVETPAEAAAAHPVRDGLAALEPWNNGKEVPRWGVAEIQKMSPSTTGRCK